MRGRIKFEDIAIDIGMIASDQDSQQTVVQFFALGHVKAQLSVCKMEMEEFNLSCLLHVQNNMACEGGQVQKSHPRQQFLHSQLVL